MSDTPVDFSFRILILGDSSVGKTSFILRYIDDSFSLSLMTTIGVESKVKVITVNKKSVKLQIWDTAGQERFRTVTSQMYKNSHGIVLLYDVTNKVTYNQISKWVENFDTKLAPDTAKILVGNKCDLEEKRAVTFEEGKELAKKYDMEFFESSAMTGVNIQEIFNRETEIIMKNYKKSDESNFQLNDNNNKPNKEAKKYCCK